MSEKFRYRLVRKVLSKDILDFLYEYILMKRKSYRTMLQEKIIPPYLEHLFGQTEDDMVPGTDFTIYGDVASEVILKKLRRFIQEEVSKLEAYDGGRLVESYSFLRIYRLGNILEKHTDRTSCQISVTLPIGGGKWPIFVDDQEFILDPGDILIYNGNLPHWRNEFKEKECVQLFLHYNTAKELKEKNLKAYDSRLHIGLPAHKNLIIK
jgi:hypothetical protein